MEKYVCKPCKYSCDKISHIKIHFDSEKHYECCKYNDKFIDFSKLKKKCYSCNNCEKEYYNRNSIWKHKKECLNKIKFEALENEIKELKTEIKNKDVEISKALDVAKINSVTANKSMQMLKYANLYLTKSEPLKQLDEEDICKIIKYLNPNNEENINEDYVKIVLSKFNNKIFAEFVGDMIIHNFTPKTISKTNFISTDTSRLCFIIMEHVKESENVKKNEWIDDKSGKRFTDLILTPILMNIKNILSEFVIINNKKTDEFDEDLMYTLGQCIKFKRDINNGKFTKPILKYVAPCFKFDKLKILSDNIKKNGVNIINENLDENKEIKNIENTKLKTITIVKKNK
jgi:hypothetical protein